MALLVGVFAVSFTACKKKDTGATKVTLDKTELTLKVNETYTLKATTEPAGQAVTWQSNDATIASVDANGLVTALKNGTAIILAKSGDAKATCNVTVGDGGGSSAIPEPDAPAGKQLIIFKFNADVCNEIVFAGSYNGWDTSDPATMLHFAPYLGGEKYNDEKFSDADGWMYVELDAVEGLEGKPVQLKSDGSFSWEFQCGDADAWKVHTGDVTIEAGYSGECNMKAYGAVTVAEMAYWKNQNSPCVVKPTHEYIIKVVCPADVKKCFVRGNIVSEGWDAAEMTATAEANTFEYKATCEEGMQFKVTGGEEGSWDNEAYLKSDFKAETKCYNKQGNYTLATETTITLEVAGFKGVHEIEECTEEAPAE